MELDALSPILTKYGLDIAGVLVGIKAVQWLTDFLKRPLRVIFNVPSIGRWSLLVVVAASFVTGFVMWSGVTALIASTIMTAFAIGAHEGKATP